MDALVEHHGVVANGECCEQREIGEEAAAEMSAFPGTKEL
jgi:hypothetical protein